MNSYYEGWLTIREIKRLSAFMAKWDEAFWNLQSIQEFKDKIEKEEVALLAGLRSDAAKRAKSMLDFLYNACADGADYISLKRFSSLICRGLENGRITFPNELLHVKCENVVQFALVSGTKEMRREDFFNLWTQIWFQRCVLECEAYVETLKGLECSYGGENETLNKFIENVLLPTFNKQLNLVKKHDYDGRDRLLGVYVLTVSRFGDHDDNLPASPRLMDIADRVGNSPTFREWNRRSSLK